MADIFVCYCRRDMDTVTHWVRQLEQRGYSVWMDLQSVDGATLWAKEIVEAIDACKVLIVMLSKDAVESPNVVKEVSLASEKGKPILPLKLKAVDIPATMQYQLANIHFLELFHGDEGRSRDAIFRSLGHHGVTPGEPASEEAPRRTAPPAGGRRKTFVAAAIAAVVLAMIITSVIVWSGDRPPPQNQHAVTPAPPPTTPPVTPPVTPPTSRPVTTPTPRPVTPPPKAAPLAEAGLKLAPVGLTVRWVKKGFLGSEDKTFTGTAGVVSFADGKLRMVTNSATLGLSSLGKRAKIKTYQAWVSLGGGESKEVTRIADKLGGTSLAMIEIDAAGLTPGTHYVLLPPPVKVAAGEPLTVLTSEEGQCVRSTQKLTARDGGSPADTLRFDAAVTKDNRGGLLMAKRGGKFVWAGVLTYSLRPLEEGEVEPNVGLDAAELIKQEPPWFTCDPAGAASAAARSHGVAAGVAN